MRRAAFAGTLAAALLAAAAPADAAVLTNAGGVLSYTAAAGTRNVVRFDEVLPGTVSVRRLPGATQDNDTISPSGCSTVTFGTTYLCAGVSVVLADGGNGNDVLDAGGTELGGTGLTSASTTLTGGDGADVLSGGARDDVLDGGGDADRLLGGAGADRLSGGTGSDVLSGDAGDDTLTGSAEGDPLAVNDGTDILRGGDGDDDLYAGIGADTVSGGVGVDRVTVTLLGFPAPAVTVTLDGVADDGAPGSGLNVLSDVEDVTANALGIGAAGTVRLVGSAATNVLEAHGSASIVGGAGNDILIGSNWDDAIDARDGYADRVKCGGGDDAAFVDSVDVVSQDCESVVAAAMQVADGDRAPTVAFSAPDSKKALSPDKPTTLTVTASDDRGIAKVQFLDDDRLLCEVAAAPYSCAYQPHGGDVGRDTLVAIAIDGAQQTASAVRPVTVSRFKARALSVNPRRKGRRFVASGRLQMPPTVAAAEGCRGSRVTVAVKAGRRTLSTHRPKLSRRCGYSATFRIGSRRGTRLTFSVRFAGNAIVRSRSATRRITG